jgi:Domain of unknown function (DUF6875)
VVPTCPVGGWGQAAGARVTWWPSFARDFEDATKTDKLPQRDLTAAHAGADWIKTFVAGTNGDLGRDGPVCPFIGRGLESKIVWLALEHVGDRSVLDLVDLIQQLQESAPELSTH